MSRGFTPHLTIYRYLRFRQYNILLLNHTKCMHRTQQQMQLQLRFAYLFIMSYRGGSVVRITVPGAVAVVAGGGRARQNAVRRQIRITCLRRARPWYDKIHILHYHIAFTRLAFSGRETERKAGYTSHHILRHLG